MDFARYDSLINGGTPTELIVALRAEFGINVSYNTVDHKVNTGGRFIKPHPKLWRNEQRYKQFNILFFTQLSFFPSVELTVTESKTHMRKTCYGFRELMTGERVYLRIEGTTIVEFRDSPAGFLIGKRYMLPIRFWRTTPRWDKIARRMREWFRKNKVKVGKKQFQEYVRHHRVRYKLAAMLVLRRRKYLRLSHYQRKT